MGKQISIYDILPLNRIEELQKENFKLIGKTIANGWVTVPVERLEKMTEVDFKIALNYIKHRSYEKAYEKLNGKKKDWTKVKRWNTKK